MSVVGQVQGSFFVYSEGSLNRSNVFQEGSMNVIYSIVVLFTRPIW